MGGGKEEDAGEVGEGAGIPRRAGDWDCPSCGETLDNTFVCLLFSACGGLGFRVLDSGMARPVARL